MMVDMILGLLALISAAPNSGQGKSIASLLKDQDSIELKIFDPNTTASCVECRGNVSEDYDIYIKRSCRFSCLHESSLIYKIISEASQTAEKCSTITYGELVFRKRSMVVTLTIDDTGKCFSVYGKQYRVHSDIVGRLANSKIDAFN